MLISPFLPICAEKCQPFYAKMVEYNMVLLCHVGEEHSIDVGGLDQSLGNPLKLRGYVLRACCCCCCCCFKDTFDS